jgi:hypothetical protein
LLDVMHAQRCTLMANKDRAKVVCCKATPSRQTGDLSETGPALESSTQRRQAAAKPISLADSGDLGAIVFFNSLLRPATLLAAFAQEWIALGCA